MAESQLYFKLRIKTIVSKDKSTDTYIVLARDTTEADAKIKMFVRSEMRNHGITEFEMKIESIVKMNIRDIIK